MIALRGVRPRWAWEAASAPVPAYASTSVSLAVTPLAVSRQPSRPRAALSTGPASSSARDTPARLLTRNVLQRQHSLAGPVPPGVQPVPGGGQLVGDRPGTGR